MRKLLVGVLVGMMLMAMPVHALRIEQPHEFSQWDSNSFSKLNQMMLQLWNITNGRYQCDVVTSDPNGNRQGNAGELVLWDSGTDKLCVNMGAKVWKCATIS